uniref:Erm Leader peptide n=1 Tax=Microviridae sp. ct9ZF1 TaxID=2824987 RepID=A0A8S5V874_9VIRU|nr:MAG TPA: Erm Leader peptide [Microviridae sp. ct9ZF1]
MHCKRTILLYQLRSMRMPNYFRIFAINIIHFQKNFSASRKFKIL